MKFLDQITKITETQLAISLIVNLQKVEKSNKRAPLKMQVQKRDRPFDQSYTKELKKFNHLVILQHQVHCFLLLDSLFSQTSSQTCQCSIDAGSKVLIMRREKRRT